MKIRVITLFPDMIAAALGHGVCGRAIARGLADVESINPRDFAGDPHRSVDDRPYGGGPGMVMLAEPIERALDAVKAAGGGKVIYLSPQGRRLDHRRVMELAQSEAATFLCGRYEGVDERVSTALVTEEVSIGDYVLSGGELPALVMVDAVARMVPGVVGDAESVVRDSFTRGLLDHPHYTRPASFRGLDVPAVLLSGHHGEIERWRRQQALRRTYERRPDLLADDAALTDEERQWLAAWRAGERNGAES